MLINLFLADLLVATIEISLEKIALLKLDARILTNNDKIPCTNKSTSL